MSKRVAATLATSMFVLAGCFGGDNSSSSNSDNGGKAASSNLSGRIADGYLAGATVCLDTNLNMVCDVGEPSAVSDSEGKYNLNISNEQASEYPVIAIVTPNVTDKDTNNYVANAYTMVSPPSYSQFISPITTLLALSAQDYSTDSLATSASILRTKLGVSDEVDLYSDFIAAQTNIGNSDSYKKVHNVAQLVARKLGQHLTSFNNGDNEGEIDKTKLVVAVDSVSKSVSELAELGELSGFNADAIAQSKSSEWNDDVKDIVPSEKFVQIENERSLPNALSGGVYQFIDTDGNKTDFLTIKLNVTDQGYNDSNAVVVTNTNGDTYTFESTDRSDVDLDFDGQVAFVKTLAGDTLVSDTYTFSLTKGEGDSLELFTDSYVQPTLASYNNNLLSAGISRVYTPFNETFLSFPVEDDELFYQALLLDAEDNVIYTGRVEQGRSVVWNDDLAEVQAAAKLLVKASDGSNHRDSHYTRELFKTALTEPEDTPFIGFARTYFRNAYDVSSSKSKQRYVFQFNAEPAAEENASTLVKKVNAFKIEYFNPNTSSYVEVLSANVQDSIFEGLGKSAEAEQNDYDLWYQLDNDGSVIYLDAFFQGDTSAAEMAVGTYRYSVTDTSGKTFYRYDYYGGLSAGFPELVASSFKAKELNADWYQLSIDSAEGGDGSLVYEFQFNVLYQGDNGEDHNYLFGLDRQREPIALVKKQTLEDAISEFEEKRGVEVDEILVDVSIFDGTKSYQMDNRFELTDINFAQALAAENQ
ncbi:hypothetical protein VINI7043_17099 [Vibrio nigripulchritudo ATCC 27043]|uniref:hypothetical protein n=1 Tax=Vibrio nigripulchritudo TaxID=28173 RepID=UPI00021C0E15|nr:hypothetical protein [Vibrio nigripulchritudo]EGU56590.1 hypothetical protein VINI7043_17099 [Vibrio nigripulchritudo ATCC 27043]